VSDINADLQLIETRNSYDEYAEFKKTNQIPSVLD
jgi:hypothetical protein